jgi:hypothetical protein
MVKMRNEYNTFVVKPEGKRPHGRPSRRWEDDIRMELRDVEQEGEDWIHPAQDRHQ